MDSQICLYVVKYIASVVICFVICTLFRSYVWGERYHRRSLPPRSYSGLGSNIYSFFRSESSCPPGDYSHSSFRWSAFRYPHLQADGWRWQEGVDTMGEFGYSCQGIADRQSTWKLTSTWLFLIVIYFFIVQCTNVLLLGYLIFIMNMIFVC